MPFGSLIVLDNLLQSWDAQETAEFCRKFRDIIPQMNILVKCWIDIQNRLDKKNLGCMKVWKYLPKSFYFGIENWFLIIRPSKPCSRLEGSLGSFLCILTLNWPSHMNDWVILSVNFLSLHYLWFSLDVYLGLFSCLEIFTRFLFRFFSRTSHHISPLISYC